MSFCNVGELKRLEVVCKVLNNSEEVRQIVETIRQGVTGKKTKDEIADIKAALIHLCNMTEGLKHQADVSFFKKRTNACNTTTHNTRHTTYNTRHTTHDT